MDGRRHFLKSSVAAIALAGMGGAVAQAAAAAQPVPVVLRGARALSPGFQLVNGWILTDRDVEALAHHAL